MPDARGKFGPYGGRFVPETIVPALDDVTEAFEEFRDDPAFRAEYENLLKTYVGRPTPLSHAQRLSQHLGGLWCEPEKLAHQPALVSRNQYFAGRIAAGLTGADAGALTQMKKRFPFEF